jgi:2-polyprenyl-3-methyl-5-hydroxy-6-metoxy-1,4-benzoquinol methylase
MALESFRLSEREVYRHWWNTRRFTNDHVSLGPRYRWVVEQLPPVPAFVLEVGSQTGGFTIPLLGMGYALIAVDMVDSNLNEVRQKAVQTGVGNYLHTMLSFVEDLEFENTFDVVLLCEILIHVTDDRLTLERAIAAAKPGGKVIVTIPWDDLYKGDEISHYYNDETFAALIKSVTGKSHDIVRLTTEGQTDPHTLAMVIVK